MLVDLEELGIRSYVSEPQRRRRKWKGQRREQPAVDAVARPALPAGRTMSASSDRRCRPAAELNR